MRSSRPAVSQKILGNTTYLGVQINQAGNTINVYDGTTQVPGARAVAYQDIIGQPTWLGFTTNYKTVMRADFSVGDVATLPKAIAIATPQAALLPKNTVSFSGSYMIQQVRHIGRFRQPDAASWVTVFDGASIPGSNSTQKLGPGFGAFT